MPETFTGAVRTDAGMFVLWNPARFEGVVDYDTWERELLDDSDIERHVAAGELVPVNIRADGTFGFEVRVGSVESPATYEDREAQCLVATSDPYLFESEGTGRLSGIEDVTGRSGSPGITVEIPKGTWSVTVYLLEWQREPGALDASGNPAPTALPDFLLVVNRATDQSGFRTSSATFG
ncbi:MAG: hypothetical protein ACLQU9_20280 [Acidimicrobiales bacterium]